MWSHVYELQLLVWKKRRQGKPDTVPSLYGIMSLKHLSSANHSAQNPLIVVYILSKPEFYEILILMYIICIFQQASKTVFCTC